MAISAAPEVLAPAVSSAVSCNAMGQARVEISDSNPCQKWVLNRSQYRGLVFNRGSPVSVAGGGSIIIKLPMGQATGDIKLLVALAAGKGFVPVGGTCSSGKPSVLLMAGAVLFICWG
ncbi:hypothetical protein RHGRI_001629 [Rhododendron griersonianum]|uniref:Uncharacterized protein n=1 Tax=Rhododendron griersonianum TaxID=479676 RepID=A0AAV6LLX6_9ERIC|nr:hypothetical protein RHGRI_001629 [Rhododendron griersonianum]